jgi:hypothetical protein
MNRIFILPDMLPAAVKVGAIRMMVSFLLA